MPANSQALLKPSSPTALRRRDPQVDLKLGWRCAVSQKAVRATLTGRAGRALRRGMVDALALETANVAIGGDLLLQVCSHEQPRRFKPISARTSSPSRCASAHAALPTHASPQVESADGPTAAAPSPLWRALSGILSTELKRLVALQVERRTPQ